MGQRLVYNFTPNRTTKELSMGEYVIAGGFSAIPTTIVTTPVERIKVIMQTQDQTTTGKKYTGMFDAAKGVYAEGGLRSLYRGTVATLARDVPGSAAYFVGFEYFFKLLKPADGSYSIPAALFAGGLFLKSDYLYEYFFRYGWCVYVVNRNCKWIEIFILCLLHLCLI